MFDVDKWSRLLRSDKYAIRLRAAKALIEQTDTPSSTLLEILDSYSDTDVAPDLVRRLAERREPDLVSAIIARLNDEQATVRKAACEVLSAIGDSSTIAPILDRISDPYEPVRTAAARAVRSLGDRAVLPTIPEPSTSYRPCNAIFEGSDTFWPFPDPASVFADDVELHSNYLLPLATLDLSRLDAALAGVVHFIQPIEPYDGVVGDGGDPYFSSTCRKNFVGYQYDLNRCHLMTDFRFFEMFRLRTGDDACTDRHRLKCLSDHYDDVCSGLELARLHYELYGVLHHPCEAPPFDDKNRIALVDCIGGPCEGGNWVNTDVPLLPGAATDANGELRYNILPLTDDGRPFLFVGQLSSSAYIWSKHHALCCDLLLFYDPISRVALTTFDWS